MRSFIARPPDGSGAHAHGMRDVSRPAPWAEGVIFEDADHAPMIRSTPVPHEVQPTRSSTISTVRCGRTTNPESGSAHAESPFARSAGWIPRARPGRYRDAHLDP